MKQNYIRHHYLQEQRLLEIQRDGVVVQLQNQHGISSAYLQFSYLDKIKVQKLLSSKIKLGLYTSEGQEILIFDLDFFYLKNQTNWDKNRIYLADKHKIRQIPTQNLILAKNNATIGVFKKVCLNQHRNMGIYPKIQKFINDPNFISVQIQKESQLQFYPQNDLNETQNQAIKKAFENHVSFIKGPPGCGKTRTIARIARLFAQRGLKLLVGAVSNIANKSLFRQIVKQVQQNNYLHENYNHMKKINLLVYTSRMQEQGENFQMSPYSLSWKIIRYFLEVNQNKFFNKDNISDYLRDFQQGKTVSNTFLSIYYQAYAKVISEADIIISTTVSATKINNKLSHPNKFYPNVCIVDQASQATWADTNCFLILGMKNVVFVGDQKQLQPTVISQNKQLKKTVFDCLCLKSKQNFTLLNTQYRMNPQIAQFPNNHFYQGKLLNGKQAQEQISDIQYFKRFPISFIEHNQLQKQFVETKTNLQDGKRHFYNEFQISIVQQILSLFPKSELKNVGIITFYDLQLQHLKYRLYDLMQNNGLTIRTCDGYQGGEKDYIIVSTVRCNMQGKIGFCKQENRVNVTITRAKKGLILIGNTYTLMQAKQINQHQNNLNVWGSLINYLHKKALIFPKSLIKQFTNNDSQVIDEPLKNQKAQKINIA